MDYKKIFKKIASPVNMGTAAGALAAALYFGSMNHDPGIAHITTAPEPVTGNQFSPLKLVIANVGERLGCDDDGGYEYVPDTILQEVTIGYDFEAYQLDSYGTMLCLWDHGIADDSLLIWRPLSSAEFDYLEFAQNIYESDPRYTIWETERRLAAITAIESDPFIAQARQNWQSQRWYDDEEEALEQHALKQQTLQRISNHIRAAFDLPPITVSLHPFNPYIESGFLAYFDTETNSIAINYDWEHGLTNRFEDVLPAIFEEVKHSIDTALAHQFVRLDIDESHPAYFHAAAITLNSKNYIFPETHARYFLEHTGSLEDDLARAFDAAVMSYHTQYLERNAKDFADIMTLSLTM